MLQRTSVVKSIVYIHLYTALVIISNHVNTGELPCDKTRKLFNSTWGIITHGPPSSNYSQDSHCEWLIKAPKNEYITLTFHKMSTECSYDYLYVYGGDRLTSPLLGSFSGRNQPQPVTSVSGSMLILLYSDANYVLEGFVAEYSVTQCPMNCSSHGTCINNKCECQSGWAGIDCSYEICPDGCGLNHGRGTCFEAKCQCSDGFSGQACDLNRNDSIGSHWYVLSSGENSPPKRAAHIAVYVKEIDSFYIFGGYDLNDVLGDLHVYSFNTSTWHYVNGNQGNASKIGNTNNNNPSDSERKLKISKEILHNNDSIVNTWKKRTNEYVENLLFVKNESGFEADKSPIKHDTKILNDELTADDVDKKFGAYIDFHFGAGRRLNESSGDSWKINQAEQEDVPSPRYGHAASRYPGGFVIYGGKKSDGSLSDELWYYNVSSQKWSLRAKFSALLPPKLTRHTLTLVKEDVLYLFGGSTSNGEFSSYLYRIVLNPDVKQDQWKHVKPRGGKGVDVRVVGHSTVYYSNINSLIVFGGITAGLARLSKLSDRMYIFKISSRYWSEIHYPRAHLPDSYVPRERAFHSAVALGNYLVIFGGYSHRHNKEEICYDNHMYIYHLGCHTWISQDVFNSSRKSEEKDKVQGVFAHAADVRNGNTLLIFGGYHGNVNADFKAYVLSRALASREGEPFDPEQICGRYRSLHECTSNPECGWCSTDENCYGRTVGTNCTTNLQTTRCPGVCPALNDCHSCLIHGDMSASVIEVPHSVVQKLRLGHCIWCVQNARCHHKDDNYGVCGLREDTPLQVSSWWGSQGTEITAVDECRIKDRRPGLTFIKYKHPVNRTQPDSVTIINATTVDFEVALRESRLDRSGAFMVARFLGFLRIPSEWANATETLKMCASFSKAVLRLSRNHLESNLETVGNVSAETTLCKTGHWVSGSFIVLHPGRYLVDFESQKLLAPGTTAFLQSKMVLMHNKSLDNSKIFTFEYLEPYQNGSCTSYSNCLHCLTDSSCGWCDLNQSCLSRDTDETQVCSSGQEDWNYLTLQPSSCINCSNHISCESCVSNDLCEWWIEEAKCSRRGSGLSGIHSHLQCPVSCHLKSSCHQCLDEKGRCVWCEATKECFSFSVYTSEYQFGLCREWIDQSHSLQQNLRETENVTTRSDRCKTCSKHLNCSACLKTLSCGWCYDVKNPVTGFCVLGDFNEPENGAGLVCLSLKVSDCSNILETVYNRSFGEGGGGWSYADCPDVDECSLKIDDCHSDAICSNTYGSFTCTCKRGFYGDGHQSCTKTCYNECVHGTCSMAPDYRCDCHLGWTGENCGIDCGCNNHSRCNEKIGTCDDCQDWTTGEFCQYCKVGSFGNATSDRQCQKCDCNHHEDPELGFCDSNTGVCFCKDNTEGDKCEKCKKGFYGNPENGGICYYQCDPRGMTMPSSSQGLGSFRSTLTPWEATLENNSPKECLWVLNSSQVLGLNSSHPGVIHLIINGDISVKCHDNSVFVYEGFPDLAAVNSQNHALGTFCLREDESALAIETKAGVLTVFFQQGNESEGFNATYSIFSCPHHCPGNRICVQNECLCQNGWTGPNCSLPLCRNNCSYLLNQGVCNGDYGRCDCRPGFGGADCSVQTNDNQIVFTELFNTAKTSGALDHLRKMIPRFGHSLVIDRRGSLWMFGGYSLSHGPLNDIRLFDTKNNTWMQVTVDSTRDASMPQGRYFHAAEIVNSRREIYVYGGIGKSAGERSDVLRDFWKFSIKHQRWVDIQTLTSPPPVAGHTITLMKDSESENLYLFGGISPQHGFLKRLWYYNLQVEQWIAVTVTGHGPSGLYGHSSVYHAPSKSFYIYGGYLLSGKRRIPSRQMFSFYCPSLRWSPLPTFEEYNPAASNLPQPRFLHSAITTKQYMLVFGGQILHKNSRMHSSDLLLAYSYACNQWFRLLHKGAPVVGSLPSFTFAQAVALDPEGGAIYVVGGFDNVIHSEVTRINLPTDLCNLWHGKEKCRSFLGCSFCSVTRPDKTLTNFCFSSLKSLKEGCDYRNGTLLTNNGVVCDGKWFQHRTCGNFKTCEDCLAKWPIYVNERPACKWCGNCLRERCVPYNHTCWLDGKCLNFGDGEHCTPKPTPASNASNETCSLEQDPISGCPLRCSDFRICSVCLLHQCRWSTVLNECISPDFQPLLCAGGICGLVLREENLNQCPEPCFVYNQCATCLKNSRCGWCSVSNGGNYSGHGVCTEGTLDKALNDGNRSCERLLTRSGKFITEDGSVHWSYATCPEENECINGHHTCDAVSEVCEDLPVGFRCVCGPGYKSSGFECEPVCSQGCVHGKCIYPDQCSCNFGYVGTNCSFQCQCNGHSNCAGPGKLNECLKCHNNTKGAQCERCKPLFVGDPTNNQTCVPCLEYCHRHTNVCVNDSTKQLLGDKSMSELISMLEEGPAANALCIGCSNNTSGRKCDECMEGYFRGTEDLTRHCRPCECHGHGDRCDPVTGEKCNCGNNTESECLSSASKNSNQRCWTLQCSKCKETYSGTPTDGHQCYKQMTLDHKFCLNSKLIEECKLKPKPLYPGQSAFFQVQPRYVNVDIRVFIDVLQGSLDLYMSLRDDSLVVTANGTSGQHLVKWDSKYKKRSTLTEGDGTGTVFRPQSYDLKLSKEKKNSLSGNESNFLESSSDSFWGLERDAEGLTTYITVSKKNSFLHVKNIKGRLVLTLPKDKFDLISTRFYLGLVACTTGDAVGPTYGILFFRQDQLHIDLFVFFSVFFSCFFLFLAACVIAWKAKQAADVRRARRRHVVEMLHMAKRPFARVLVDLDAEDAEAPAENRAQHSPHRKGNKGCCCCYYGEVKPVALEPTEDGLAAIATFFVRLPGSSEVPVQMSLASSLVMVSRGCHLNGRVFLRRRSSHYGSS